MRPNLVPALRRSSADPAAGLLTARERQLLKLLREKGAMTRATLIQLTGLSGTAVFRATEELTARGLVEIGEPVARGRGQPSNKVSLKPSSAHALGLSVMTDQAELVLLDLAGNVRVSEVISPAGMRRADVTDRMDAFIARVEKEKIATRNSIVAMGIAVAGFFVGDGSMMNTGEALEDWALLDLGSLFEERFDIPVMVENIANAAAMGEYLLGAGRDVRTMAYINVASGFGGGLVLDGQLWRGQHGNAGEFAGLLKISGTPVPNLESLRDELRRAGVATSNVRDMLARYDPSWPGLETWVAQSAPVFERLGKIIHLSFDVDMIVLGGRLPRSLGEQIISRAGLDQTSMDQRVRRGQGHPAPRMVCAEITEQAAAIGAASLPLSALFFLD